jgi:hypothetical protein
MLLAYLPDRREFEILRADERGLRKQVEAASREAQQEKAARLQA